MNTRQKRQRIKYKTHTDINNYNKFLLELDCKNKNKSNILAKNKEDDNIDDIIKNINANYKDNYSHKNFHGQCAFENIISKFTNDPNVYESQEQLRLINKKDSETINPICIKEKININVEINNINDLLTLINDYPDKKEIEYNINIQLLHKIKEPLIELNNMIGMKDLKTNIVDQILYFTQELHKNNNQDGDFMHTVIYGPPGTGKTEIAKIIGKIYSKIGILNKGTFKKVTRSDLIAGYLGQTALKTQEVVKDALGGVLFIDEAYALGNPDKRDSFSKECIDTLCEALSDNKDNLMVIIAGYENELKECFFNYNQGLDSRFTWRFKTDEYTGEDLHNIFLKKVNEIGWTVHEDSNITTDWFTKNKEYFRFYGRDIETVLAKTKISHSRRVFCRPIEEKKKITLKDLEKGFEIYLKNDDVKSRKDAENLKKQIYNSLYC